MRQHKEKRDAGRDAAIYAIVPASLAAGMGYAAYHIREDTTVAMFLENFLGAAFLIWFSITLIVSMSWDGIKEREGKALIFTIVKYSLGWCLAAFIFAGLIRQ